MDIKTYFFFLTLLSLSWAKSGAIYRKKRAVTNSLADVLGIKSNAPAAKKKPVKITPPLRLKPGETAVRPPGWKHCIKNIRATLTWKSIRSPGYPDFLESQIQCSWIIEAPIGMRVKLAFRDLDMIGTSGSCAKQFVQIIDITTGKSQGRFCGSTRPGDYVTLGTKARLDLQADKAVTKVRGFFVGFMAVKDIPGFRSSKTFPSMGIGSDVAPGKVNVKGFASNSQVNLPKPSAGAKRANKRLVYESDLNPQSSDLSATPTDSEPQNRVGSNDDLGWIGNDAEINTQQQSNRNSNNAPVRIRPTGQQRTPLPRYQRPTVRQPNGEIIVTQSTLPVRIRATLPPPTTTVSPEDANRSPVIYGQNNQPHDPNHYTTLHPVRMDAGKFIDHREEKLTTTNLIIIIACAVLFLVIFIGLVVFVWYFRKRRNKKRKKKRELEKKKKDTQEEKREQMEMNVSRLLGSNQNENDPKKVELQQTSRQDYLPGPPMPPARDSPPRYPNREHSVRRDSTQNLEGVRRDNSDDRGLRIVSKNGVKFYPNPNGSRPSEHHFPAQAERNPRRGLSTISRNEMEMHPHVNPGYENRPDFYERKVVTPSAARPETVTYYPREIGPRPDQHFSGHSPLPRRPPSPTTQRYPGHPVDYRNQTTDLRRQPRSYGQPLKFHSLDPRDLDEQHYNDRRTNEYRGPRHPQNLGSRRQSKNRQRSAPNHNSAGDEVDEDYCSGNSDDSGSGKAPMRREYSPWELEQQKKDRRKKLISGR